MKHTTTLGLSLALAVGFATGASAQTTSSSAGNLTSDTTSTSTAVRKPRTSATPEMINEAIQRSEARNSKELETGRAQQWGSEEPFVYNPAVRRFNANQQ